MLQSPQVRASFSPSTWSNMKRKVIKERKDHFGDIIRNPIFFDPNETSINKSRKEEKKRKLITNIESSRSNVKTIKVYDHNAALLERFAPLSSRVKAESRKKPSPIRPNPYASPTPKKINASPIALRVAQMIRDSPLTQTQNGGKEKNKKPAKGKKQ